MYKLVRDNIPAITKESGEVCDYAIIQNNEFYFALLKDKLVEEVNEFLWQGPTTVGTTEELIDILTVVYYLADALGISKEELIAKYESKLKTNGGFDKKYVAFFADPTIQEN